MYPIPPFPIFVDPKVRVCPEAVPLSLAAEMREIGDYYLSERGVPGQVGFHEGKREDSSIRACTSAWLPWPHEAPKVKWLYEAVGNITQQANGQFWQYDIWGFQDNLHYVCYSEHDGAEGGKFNWHRDSGDDWRRTQRKLACVIMLSDPEEYDGGDVEIFDGREQTLKRLDRGSAYVITSQVQHRVCPVTAGERRVLIGWLCGPRFR